MRWLIRWSNGVFSSLLLVLFYIFIIPFGKLMFIIIQLVSKKNRDAYWQTPTTRELDIDSPY